MNRSIIALQGDPNTGKSITIGLLYEMMKQNGFTVVKDKWKKNSKDFFVLLKKNHVLIGVSSYGDTEHWIKERCGRFVNAGCHFIVCACHNNGKTVNAVLSFSDYEPILIHKRISISIEQMNANTSDASELLEIINDLIPVKHSIAPVAVH
jgi:hypothetical protein